MQIHKLFDTNNTLKPARLVFKGRRGGVGMRSDVESASEKPIGLDGSLSPAGNRKVQAYSPSQEEIKKAFDILKDFGLPQMSVVMQAAKILGAIDEKDLPQEIEGGGVHKMWLLAESTELAEKSSDTRGKISSTLRGE